MNSFQVQVGSFVTWCFISKFGSSCFQNTRNDVSVHNMWTCHLNIHWFIPGSFQVTLSPLRGAWFSRFGSSCFPSHCQHRSSVYRPLHRYLLHNLLGNCANIWYFQICSRLTSGKSQFDIVGLAYLRHLKLSFKVGYVDENGLFLLALSRLSEARWS